jgi:hypothetical protein
LSVSSLDESAAFTGQHEIKPLICNVNMNNTLLGCIERFTTGGAVKQMTAAEMHHLIQVVHKLHKENGGADLFG